jgi:hypothetical protein
MIRLLLKPGLSLDITQESENKKFINDPENKKMFNI